MNHHNSKRVYIYIYIYYDVQSFELHRLNGYEIFDIFVCRQKVLITRHSSIWKLPLSMPTVPRLVALVINMDSLPRSHCMGIGWPVEFPLPLTGAVC